MSTLIPAVTKPSTYRELYPPIQPYDTFRLPVDSLHTLYVEQSGNPKGNPVIVMHGGPGGGTPDFYRQYFNPKLYRVIMFDQRGAGKSTPLAELKDNTTWHLVDDIETIRKKLNIDKWVVFGGSWGSTLSLAYAETHPDRVKALILRGIFMLRRHELEWFYQSPGANFIFPDAWEQYKNVIPPVQRADFMSAYYRILTGDDEELKLKAAVAWSAWELTTSRLYVDPTYVQQAQTDTEFAVTFARIECHYFVNGGFFRQDDQLLADVHKIAHIPGVIVQGRYDLVCPALGAYDLSKAWTKGDLQIVADAGHSCKEEGIRHCLLEAADKYATI